MGVPNLTRSTAPVASNLPLNGYHHNTKRAYTRALDRFLAWCANIESVELSRAVLRKYRAWLERRVSASSSVNQELSALRRMLLAAAAVAEDGQPASQAELTRQTHEWAINAEQALRSAKACGHEPGGIERPLEQARQSERDWRAILRDFISTRHPSDYRWAPPNRRFISSGLYLPSVERRGVGET